MHNPFFSARAAPHTAQPSLVFVRCVLGDAANMIKSHLTAFGTDTRSLPYDDAKTIDISRLSPSLPVGQMMEKRPDGSTLTRTDKGTTAFIFLELKKFAYLCTKYHKSTYIFTNQKTNKTWHKITLR